MKIILVINSMISRNNLITDVSKDSQDVFYFVFDRKHKWTMYYDESDDNFKLVIYPDPTKTIDDIKNIDINNLAHVAYQSKEFRTIEAKESFRELYKLIQEKLYNVDDAFDEILNVF